MSDWTSSEAKEFLDIIRGEMEKVVREQVVRQSLSSTCLAVVIDSSDPSAIIVRLLSSPADGSQDLSVRNKSGSILEDGDSVWLQYWGGDYTNAYIAVRNMGDTEADITATGIGAISFAEVQTLTPGQKTQALSNAGAASVEHASQHAVGGGDPIAPADIGAVSVEAYTYSDAQKAQIQANLAVPNAIYGTWTPTITMLSGTITSYSISYAQYQKIGNFVTINVGFTISNKGTGSGAIYFTLPPGLNASRSTLYGRETTISGKMVQVLAEGGSAYAVYYDNSSAWVNGVAFVITGSYKAA